MERRVKRRGVGKKRFASIQATARAAINGPSAKSIKTLISEYTSKSTFRIFAAHQNPDIASTARQQQTLKQAAPLRTLHDRMVGAVAAVGLCFVCVFSMGIYFRETLRAYMVH